MPDPFIAPRLLKNASYMVPVFIGFCAMLANISMFVFVPLMVIEVNGATAGTAGLILAPGALAIAVASPVGGRLSDRVGSGPLILVGLTTMAVAVLFVSSFGAGGSLPVVALGMLGAGLGFALVNPANTNAAANALPKQDVGVGMGVFQGAAFLGGAAGPALIGALLTFRGTGAAEALNPLYGLGAPAFSDAFLALVGALTVALIVASGLATPTKGRSAEARSGACPRLPSVRGARPPRARRRSCPAPANMLYCSAPS